MKKFVAMMALVLAVPAAAQTAPATPHQSHQQHQTHGQGAQPHGTGHAQHGQPPQAGQGQHQGHDMQDGCCADRNGNGRMDCCENMAQGQGHEGCRERGQQQGSAQPSGHQNH
jgi:hypothetical protein